MKEKDERDDIEAEEQREIPQDEDGDTKPTGQEEPEEEQRQVENEDDPNLLWGEGISSQKDAPPDDRSRVEEEPDADDNLRVEEELDGEGRYRRYDASLTDAAVLALGKISAPETIPLLLRIAREVDDLALHSTVIHALGLIGTPEVHEPLMAISETHPNELIRDQAKRTLQRLQATKKEIEE